MCKYTIIPSSPGPIEHRVPLNPRIPLHVGLYWNLNVQDDDIVALVEGCPQLTKLNLSGCKRLTDTSLAKAGRCRLNTSG